MRLGKVYTLSPLVGAMVFAGIFFSGGMLFEWLFRSVVAEEKTPLWWSLALTQAIGCLIAAFLLYLLLDALRRHRRAAEQLNHELRNALQIMAYILHSCDEVQAEQARAAIVRMSYVLREISQQLER